ncbi:MAG: DUF3135 domain-containing protein [Deltaproteobacteria bacterium]|nr:DUF3135 domain-containing protein [Deltaproteobacteria bacterium]
MGSLMWAEDKEKRRKEALQRHESLHRLFKDDRLSFERERRDAIHELINSVEDEDTRKRLWDLQNRWDKRMKGAGSAHNRLVLAQTFFWEHFHEVWTPGIQKLNHILNGEGD